MKAITLFLLVLYVSVSQGDVFADLKYLSSIFSGVYDNFDQYKNDIIDGVQPEERHLYMTSSVVVEDVPIFKERENFYLEQYQNGNKSDFTRQKLYTFFVDEEERIHLKLYSFVNPATFAHAKSNSPLFKELTQKDIVYSVGCDVFWVRISDDVFRSYMHLTCISEVDGVKFIITDTNYLSSTYITVNEKWIFVNNGSVFRFNPVPYNETKQHSLHKQFSKLDTFHDIVNSLMSGRPISYSADPSHCELLSRGHRPTNTSQVKGDVTNFSYIDGEYGPYLKFQTITVHRNATGHDVLGLHDGVVYKNGMLLLRVTSLTMDHHIVLDSHKVLCSTDPASPSVVFFSEKVKIPHLADYDDLLSALHMDASISYVVNLDLCQGGITGSRGGKLEDLEVSPDGTEITSALDKMSTNNEHLLSDVNIGRFYFNSSSVVITDNKGIQCQQSWQTARASIRLYQIVKKSL